MSTTARLALPKARRFTAMDLASCPSDGTAARTSGSWRTDSGKSPVVSQRKASAVDQMEALRSRSALPITDTELKDMAAAAIIGDSSRPNTGYSTPAATGTPSAL